MAFYENNTDGETFKYGKTAERLPFFYSHGELEIIYDIVSCDISELRSCTQIGWHLTDFVHLDGRVSKCIVFKRFRSGMITGLVLKIDDLDGIKEIIESYPTDSYCDNDREFLENNLPSLLAIIKKNNRK